MQMGRLHAIKADEAVEIILRYRLEETISSIVKPSTIQIVLSIAVSSS